MIELIYVSSANHQMKDDELLKILDQSRLKNMENNITGMLLYAKGNFFQVLEGEEEIVEATYERILKDDRHKNCYLIDKNNIEQRSFPNWSMGFENLNDKILDIEGYSDFMNRDMQPEELAQNKTFVVECLYLFKEENS